VAASIRIAERSAGVRDGVVSPLLASFFAAGFCAFGRAAATLGETGRASGFPALAKLSTGFATSSAKLASATAAVRTAFR
jgi:hypothetical protein